jgi:hypothetical protein
MPVVSSAFQHTLGGIGGSTNLDDYAVDHDYVFVVGDDPFTGTVASAEPVEIASDVDDGILGTWFSDLYYHRIWLIEKHTDLGNLLADQERTIEVWNAHFTDKTISQFDVTGDIEVDGLASVTLNPLESTLYTVSIPLVGAPTLEATIVWTFADAEKATFTATIVGTRVIPFALRHNWASPVLEQISFKTDVLGAISGKEQRIGLMSDPRRRVEMTYLTLTALDRAYLENVLYGWQGRSYALPLWSDVTRIRAATTEGATVFDVDTTTRDFDIGGLLFVTNGVHHDTLEIIDLDEDSVTTKTGALNTYNEGAKIAPARLAVLESKFDLSRLTNQIEDVRLAWALLADQVSTNRRVSYTPVTYRDVEVYNVSNDYSEAIGITQTIAEEMSDNGTGIFRKLSIGDQYPRRTYPFRELKSRDQLGQFIEWVYRRKGKLNPFWFVERVPSFFLHADATDTDTTFVVKTGGYTQFSFPSQARRDIAILTSAGWRYRRITGSALNGDGTETITLDTSLGVDLIASDNPMMSFLKFVRLEQDLIELSYESAGVIKTATSFIDLLTNN